MDNQNKFPREGSRGSGKMTAYSVEARSSYHSPEKLLNGQIMDKEWRRINFEKTTEPFGVPNRLFCKEAEDKRLMTWQAANAMRWWLHASQEHSYCLETRLIKHTIEHSYRETIESCHDVIGGEDKSGFMPRQTFSKEWGPPSPAEDQTTKGYVTKEYADG